MRNSMMNIRKKLQGDQVEAFYLNEMYKGQSVYARWLNTFLYRFLVFAVAFLLFLLSSNGTKIVISLVSAISVVVIYHYVAGRFKQKKLKKTKETVNQGLAGDIFWKKIRTMDRELYIDFIADLFTKLPGFSEVEKTDFLQSEGINIICRYKGELTAVQCHLLEGEDTVEARSVRELSRAMSIRKYTSGIVISTTDFRNDAKNFCSLIKDKREIILLGKNELVSMAKEGGKYSSDEEVKNLLIKRIEHRERLWQDAGNKIFSKPRVATYFIYGTVLLVLGTIINLNIKYLYYFSTVVLYSIGIFTIFHSYKTRDLGNKLPSWQDKLN
ncbi:MAG: restriction endonuclease [Bacillota bacterium]